jgi:hypothetical protein
MENPNPAALSKQLAEVGETRHDIMLLYRGFNAYAEAFRKESEANEK